MTNYFLEVLAFYEERLQEGVIIKCSCVFVSYAHVWHINYSHTGSFCKTELHSSWNTYENWGLHISNLHFSLSFPFPLEEKSTLGTEIVDLVIGLQTAGLKVGTMWRLKRKALSNNNRKKKMESSPENIVEIFSPKQCKTTENEKRILTLFSHTFMVKTFKSFVC